MIPLALHAAPMRKITDWLPTSVKEMQLRGWDSVDVVLFSGDAYVDHPSFGTAVIARVLESAGYCVAVVAQPNWQDDLRDFRKFGRPRLFFGVSAGNMDSMVNHYTANRRLRSDDAYTAGGKAGFRPDRAATVYSQILKRLFPDVPVVLGGIEASLRRLAHYDYWENKLMPSILQQSGADILVYGMGELPILTIARRISEGGSLDDIPQTATLCRGDNPQGWMRQEGLEPASTLLLHSFERCCTDKRAFAENFRRIEESSNRSNPPLLIEPFSGGWIVVHPPFSLPESPLLDSWYELPYTRLPHPRYRDKPIPAYEMIRFSITLHRGCFGGCSFCTISAHQGKFVASRSCESVLKEIDELAELPGFAGIISDLGGPSANMYQVQGANLQLCASCRRPSCLFPSVCKNLHTDPGPLLALYERVRSHRAVRKAFVGSGIRYDLFLDTNGSFLSGQHADYFSTLLRHHVSGRLKVAPEHTSDAVLKWVRKPSFTLFERLKERFDRINSSESLRLQLVPYFVSSLPGCRLSDMHALSEKMSGLGLHPEQVQDFTPTPMTLASAMFYSGMDPYTMQPLFTETRPEEKLRQKGLFFGEGRYVPPASSGRAKGTKRGPRFRG